MSISVKNLTKVYGSQRAIDDLTFEVGDAQVLGFLGPNGAGKSTTMKILSCYLQPTEGQAMVNGFDVQEEPLKVREGLGYLPEHNPLYLERYVREYLGFVASLHKLKNAKLRIAEVIGITGLEKKRTSR